MQTSPKTYYCSNGLLESYQAADFPTLQSPLYHPFLVFSMSTGSTNSRLLAWYHALLHRKGRARAPDYI